MLLLLAGRLSVHGHSVMFDFMAIFRISPVDVAGEHGAHVKVCSGCSEGCEGSATEQLYHFPRPF